MTLETIIYENIPATYTGTGTTATKSETIDMVTDRSLPEGLYLIKFVGGSTLCSYINNSTDTSTYIKLVKDTNLISYIHPTSLTRCEWNGTYFLAPPNITATNSFAYILTNSATKPIKISYKHYRTSSNYYNTMGTFVFQKLRDLNTGEE